MNHKKVIASILMCSVLLTACDTVEDMTADTYADESIDSVEETVTETTESLTFDTLPTETGDPFAIDDYTADELSDYFIDLATVTENETLEAVEDTFLVEPYTEYWNINPTIPMTAEDKATVEFDFNISGENPNVIANIVFENINNMDYLSIFDDSAISVSFSTDDFDYMVDVYENMVDYLAENTEGDVVDERNEGEEDHFGGWYASSNDGRYVIMIMGGEADTYYMVLYIPMIEG